jgi:hypothetical protein
MGCAFSVPVVTARARRDLLVTDPARTQRGRSAALGSRWVLASGG